MPSLLWSIRRHLGISLPLFALYAMAILLATNGDVGGRTMAVLAAVFVLTLLTPAAVSALNRRHLRGSWSPALAEGEQVLHDGPADRYQAGFFGWLFLTDRRLVLYRVGGMEDLSVPLAELAQVRATRYAGIFATDLRVELTDGTVETLQVEGSREWVERVQAALAGASGGVPASAP
jgi:hypothetical protein